MKYSRIVLIFIALVVVSFMVLYIVYVRGYNQGYGYDNISNSLFIVGVVFFFPALTAQLGSYKFFYGIQYALKGLVSNDFRSRYKSFSDYLLGKKTDVTSTIYTELMLSSGTLLAASIIIGMFWGRTL